MLIKSLSRAVRFSVLIVLSFAQPLGAEAPRAESRAGRSAALMVSTAVVDPGLELVAEGFAEWIRLRAGETGIAVVPGWSIRRSIAAGQRQSSRDTPAKGLHASAPDQEQLMAIAVQHGVRSALLLDLRSRGGRIEADFRLYDVETGKLYGGGLVEAPARLLVYQSEEALNIIDERLGVVGGRRTPDELRSLTLGALSAATRALSLMDRRQLGHAWREIAGMSNPLARSIAKTIDKLAARPTTSPTLLAQLANAKGDSRRAWSHISELAVESYREPVGAVSTLNAAGEAQLAIGGLRKARAYFARALEVEPDNAEAALGLAQVFAVERRTAEARVAFERAAALDADSPRPMELAADLVVGDPPLRAQMLLKAADRNARRLDSKTAQRQYAKAIALDSTVARRALRGSGDLHARVGEYDEALAKYKRARELGREGPGLLVVEARTQNAAGMKSEAAATYEKVLRDHDPGHPDALVELGELYADQGRAAEAIPLLERASAQEPEGSRADRALARALAERNDADDHARALELFKESAAAELWDTQDLRTMASLQAETGDLVAATVTLERALDLRGLDAGVQRDLVAIMNAQGDAEAAGIWASRFSHSGLNEFIEQQLDSTEPPRASFEGGFDEIGQLIHSFGEGDAATPLVVFFQGLREPMTLEQSVLDWFALRTTDKAALGNALYAALEAEYVLSEASDLSENFAREVEKLFDFDAKSSLSLGTITDLNISYDTDAVFLARLVRKPGDPAAAYGSCWGTDHYELQMRRLAGNTDDNAQVLSNRACLSGGTAGKYGVRNYKAALPCGLLLFLSVFPLVRGWGRLEVDFKLPDGATALFAVSLTRRPSKVRDRSEKTRAAAINVFRNRLHRVNLFERRLQGTHMSFRWVPARRARYYLTIRGPLVDATTDGLIGEFLEERFVKIERGKVTHFDFDLCRREATVNVEVKRGDRPVSEARVGLRGVPGSTRFCPGGKGSIFISAGEHVVVVGTEDRVAEKTIYIEGLVPTTVEFDIESEFVFAGCPEAVEPYLEGDYPTARRALTATGQDAIAEEIGRLRSAPLAAPGSVVSAAVGTQPGVDPDAPAIERSPEAWAEMARAHDQAGEYGSAAEAYREAGDIINAARCFEEIYDWQTAIECYQDLGDIEKVLSLMERSGELYDAGMLAAEHQQPDRAIRNFQQIGARHPRYSECCRALAEILSARGEHELAIERFDEGLKLLGTSDVSLELLSRYAELLAGADRLEDALEVYEGIRRRDVHFGSVDTHIESLRKQLSQATADGISDNAATIVPLMNSIPSKSRYEIQGELGRGGMGVVYRALDRHLQRVVALKVLSGQVREYELALELFLREARSAAALNHRNIVTVYDAGQEGSMDFISMECLEGSGLDSILKQRGALNPRTVANLGLQVAAGLDYAQQRKIIHRDIKPSNLFLTTDRIVKIMDFGLAKMVEEVRRASTIIGGTPNYMAPEQAVGNPTDHRADLYALGGTLFHLATGTVPYESGDVTYQHAHSPVPDPREREVSLPAPLARLIMKLMAKLPEGRYQGAREVAVELQAFLKSSS